MKKFLPTVVTSLFTTLLFPSLLLAQQGDNGTSGYSSGATMGLIIIIVLVVIGIAGFTWRRKGKDNPPS